MIYIICYLKEHNIIYINMMKEIIVLYYTIITLLSFLMISNVMDHKFHKRSFNRIR